MNSLELSRLSEKDNDSLRALIAQSRFRAGRSLERYAGQEVAIDYTFSLLTSENSSFAVFDAQNLIGVATFKDLEWDSKLYGKRMAEIAYCLHDEANSSSKEIYINLIGQIEATARNLGYDFLLCKTFTDNLPLIHALENSSFILVDTLLDYMYSYHKPEFNSIIAPENKLGIIIRNAKASDRDTLVRLASKAFKNHFGRYHSDERTSSELATKVYQQWVHSSMDGYADCILVAEFEGSIVGYTTWRYPQAGMEGLGAIAHYSIAGVDPDYAGQNIFRLLSYAGMQALQSRAKFIIGPTHINNYPVQRGYDSLGWKISDARQSFHKWLD